MTISEFLKLAQDAGIIVPIAETNTTTITSMEALEQLARDLDVERPGDAPLWGRGPDAVHPIISTR